jgi:hypothetical protein
VTVISFLAYLRVTHGARILELVLIWAFAVGGSTAGSVLIAALDNSLAKVEDPYTSEWYAELLGAAIGMLFSIPIGIVGGGLAGTMLAALLIYIRSWRPTLIASAGAFVAGALASGLALVPIGFFLGPVTRITVTVGMVN